MATKGYDRRATNIRLVVEGVANDVPAGVTPKEGMQYVVGTAPNENGAFKNAQPNQIAEYFDGEWVFSTPQNWHLEIFDLRTKQLKRWNDTAWEVVADLSGSGSGGGPSASSRVYETHILTDDDIANKSFRLEHNVLEENNGNVWLSISGVAQLQGVDFAVVNGDSVSWENLAMDEIELLAGDVCYVQYDRA